MQFFKHHTNMRHDLKIQRLIRKYGLEGYGLYNLIIESISGNICKDAPLPELQETSEDIATLYNNDTVKIEEMMQYMIKQNLFEVNEISRKILCFKIYKFLDQSQTGSPQMREQINNYKKLLGSVMICHDMSGNVKPELELEEELELELELEKKKKARNIIPPSLIMVSNYLNDINENRIDAHEFIDFYTSKNWMIGKNKMIDWQAAIRTWQNKENKSGNKLSSIYKKLQAQNK